MTTTDARKQVASACVLLGCLSSGLGALLSVIFTLAGGPAWDDWILDSRGVQTEARGVRAARPTRGNIDPRGEVSLRIEFDTPDGATRSGSVILLGAVALAAERGTPVFVEYDPLDPTRHRAVGGRASLFGLWVILPAGCVPLGIGLAALGLLLRAKSPKLEPGRV